MCYTIVKDNDRSVTILKLDLTGQTFGYWTVIKEVEPNKHGQTQWLCQCKCGTIKIKTTNHLRTGRSKSCGCYKKEVSTNDLTGKKFGKLTAISIVGKNQRANVWHCICDCGNEVDVKSTLLVNGTTKSCGCLLVEYQKRRKVDFTGLVTDDIEVTENLGSNKFGSVTYKCICNHCGNEFTCTDHALRQGCVHSCGCTYGSKLENEVAEFIKELVPDIKMYRSWKVDDNDNHEFDIYLPDYSLAIEVNGSLYHSTDGNPYTPKDKLYHQNKFLLAREHNIRLINIFDVFWGDKMKCVIKNALLPKTKIFARKCVCKVISKDESNAFLNKYHFQGSNRNSKWNYGLYYNGELVSLMTFGIKRYTANCVEIIRYVNKDNISVIGGSQKLMKHFIADMNPKKIFTYSDNNLFTGSVYKRLGFVCNGMTTPDYYWFSKKYGYMSRETCQPKKLIEKYPALYDSSSKSVEKDIMLKLNAKRIYMCGNTRWVLNLR